VIERRHRRAATPGLVVYTQIATTGNWGDCTIDGIYFQQQPRLVAAACDNIR
jgi:hypothetical protein